MKLTRASSYALHALSYLSEKGASRPLASHAIARECGIPDKFLLKVLKPLAHKGVLVSLKGPNGGYRLARAANQISVLEVIESVEGPLQSGPAFASSNGHGSVDRQLQALCEQVVKDTRQRLQALTVADLAGKGKKTRVSTRPGSHS